MIQLKILLVEDSMIDVKLFKAQLDCNENTSYQLINTKTLTETKDTLRKNSFDIILLDLNLPDSAGFDTFTQIHHEFINIPIVILTGDNDEELALKMIREGAQDYLFKGSITSVKLSKTIEYSIHRHKLVYKLMTQSTHDELTGLLNRRGFENLTIQKIKECNRNNSKAGLFYIDLNGLKWINDTHGHQAGDDAIRKTAQVLLVVCRDSDIKARIGGDEFVILTSNYSSDIENIIKDRIAKTLKLFNTKLDKRFNISLSLGFAYYNPDEPISTDELIKLADAAMFKEKQKYYLKNK